MDPENKRLSQEAGALRTASRFGPTLVIDGNLTGHEDLDIQGNFNGQIDLALHDLTIQKTAKVKAEVKAKNLFIYGHLEGKIWAERVVISDTGRFSGELVACKISIQNGAKFVGTIKISQDYRP